MGRTETGRALGDGVTHVWLRADAMPAAVGSDGACAFAAGAALSHTLGAVLGGALFPRRPCDGGRPPEPFVVAPPLALLSAGGGIDVGGCVASADAAAVAARERGDGWRGGGAGGRGRRPSRRRRAWRRAPCASAALALAAAYRRRTALRRHLPGARRGGRRDARRGRCTGSWCACSAPKAAAALRYSPLCGSRTHTQTTTSGCRASSRRRLRPRAGRAAAARRRAARRLPLGREQRRSLPPSRRPSCRIVSCDRFGDAQSAERHWLLRESGLGLTELRSVPVHHCADAWGCVLTHRSGWKVVYSGDTRPCDALVAAGAGATLLIHEATFDDDREGDAVKKRHSTRAEAIDVRRRMGAYRTLLTHLSQRYARDPLIGASEGEWLVAFDLLMVELRDLPALGGYAGPIAAFFRGEREAVERAKTLELEEQLERSRRLEAEAEAALGERGVQVA